MARPLIQLALDSLDRDRTLELARVTAPYVDIFEIGTPCIKYNGIEIVRELKRRHPDRLVLVDLKTMDAGEYEAAPFYAAGADICTVLGVSGPATIAGVVKAAQAHNAEVQVDLINVPDKAACAREAARLGAQIIGVHTGLDAQAQGQTPFADLESIARLKLPVRISVAGGINQNTASRVAKAGADIVVVGAAIYGAPCPATAARTIRELLEGAHHKFIVSKIGGVLAATDKSYEARLTGLLERARRIFVAGAGRSGLVGRFFAMRLMHGGYQAYIVGEIVTPSIRQGDLLIVISGSGETETMIAYAKKAKEQGASIALITTRDKSTIGDMADVVFRIGTPEQYGKVVGMPMGTTFELSTLVLLEATISHIIHTKKIPEEQMRTRHANLE
ncbi:bifunctional 3-hexulose-6-phosphate synthase/6-phospho-3-hexuloisomerase [Methylococcus capsulatus]|jgi:3-hexulose-6-phosphate synthase/6-phospho-3-hexuloisomerase|uniref:3-hexulose-6-phosphate synthase n=1 Tax=Methylococcus capsulatus (strain ATCC 33009 / NCIMB 11132 / Bath) TaxID=243233 RepID=Q603R2_METCA|nr:bifunctional 3-hexulose-6-phosphate synthase/6-phospho-3-hexuloisomerase [Methylococcus capsulatus]AAU91180.1 putative hexulose-6-phosphate synthase/SIS domain protein [Methylococcus capsulatus str. Bath]QXP86777.1 3-hexulose-6-phosphate synthase [Methylococcus capsulatus]QXP91896.1 3-hexulose-6-phosphate synthase [Methylococcus capsulatus]QXP93545.1 3-hexulose-6-phosphate synthase [Methylococcus capsulatus]UQN11750.1 3-hexulose-6-phosphate synthase [Methylococcus capsulatus]